MGFFRFLWGLSRSTWMFAGMNPVFRNAGALWMLVFFLFCIVFAVAWLFGYPPDQVGAWLGAHEGLWRWLGGWLWRIFWGGVLLLCAAILFAVGLEWFGKKAEEFKDTPRDIKGGCCGLTFVAVASYIAWVAVTMPLD